MNINIVGHRYTELKANWHTMYEHIVNALYDLGHKTRVQSKVVLRNKLDHKKFIEGLKHTNDSVYIYNHAYLLELQQLGKFLGSDTIIMKPGAPSSNYFALDRIGYACTSSITYKKPYFEDTPFEDLYGTEIPALIENKANKWDNSHLRRTMVEKTPKLDDIPKDHILILGQVHHDETVTDFSFGDHVKKLAAVVDRIENSNLKNPLVIKMHPSFVGQSKGKGYDEFYKPLIDAWKEKHTVVLSMQSIHDFLPYSKIAVLENSSAGIECLMHNVPIISYGYPEYHWVTFDMRHLPQLIWAIENVSKWWDEKKSKSWLAWYLTRYMCHDFESTRRRLSELLQ